MLIQFYSKFFVTLIRKKHLDLHVSISSFQCRCCYSQILFEIRIRFLFFVTLFHQLFDQMFDDAQGIDSNTFIIMVFYSASYSMFFSRFVDVFPGIQIMSEFPIPFSCPSTSSQCQL